MDNCCDPTPIICTTSTYCIQETSTYCVRHNQGEDLSCIGAPVASNLRLSQILKLMDTKICQMSGAGDYSTFNIGCLTPVTTQQSWVEQISAYVCTLNTTINSNYITLGNLITAATNENIGISTRLLITGTCPEIAGLAYLNGTTTLNDHIIKMRTAICDTYNLLQTRTDLSSIVWNSCFSSVVNVNTAIQNLIDEVCIQKSQIASLSVAGSCGRFDKFTFSADFVDTITSTNSCFDSHSIYLDKEKLIKVSSTDICDGYLGDKITHTTGITTATTIVTTSVCNYTLASYVDIVSPENLVSVTINATLYTLSLPTPVTNTTSINNYLNSLGLGSFTTILLGSQLTILAHETTGNVPNSIILSISGAVSFSSIGCVTSSCEKVVVGLDNTYLNGTWYDPQTWSGGNLYGGTYVNGGASPVKFRKSGLRTVKIKGKMNNSVPLSVSTDEIVFTLPVGYRPLELQSFVVGSTSTPVLVEVATTGVITIQGTLTPFGNTSTYLNITFDTD